MPPNVTSHLVFVLMSHFRPAWSSAWCGIAVPIYHPLAVVGCFLFAFVHGLFVFTVIIGQLRPDRNVDACLLTWDAFCMNTTAFTTARAQATVPWLCILLLIASMFYTMSFLILFASALISSIAICRNQLYSKSIIAGFKFKHTFVYIFYILKEHLHKSS